jgi:hypothetical protein
MVPLTTYGGQAQLGEALSAALEDGTGNVRAPVAQAQDQARWLTPRSTRRSLDVETSGE